MVFEPNLERQVAICQVLKKRKATLGSRNKTKPHKLEIARHIPGNTCGWLKHKVPAKA